MSNTLKLLESIVSKKPTDTQAIFEELMLEKIRDRVNEFSETVTENFFNEVEDEDDDEEIVAESKKKKKEKEDDEDEDEKED
jgi:hypothetical protein